MGSRRTNTKETKSYWTSYRLQCQMTRFVFSPCQVRMVHQHGCQPCHSENYQLTKQKFLGTDTFPLWLAAVTTSIDMWLWSHFFNWPCINMQKGWLHFSSPQWSEEPNCKLIGRSLQRCLHWTNTPSLHGEEINGALPTMQELMFVQEDSGQLDNWHF